MISLICKYCEKTFQVKPYRAKIAICCSRKCLWHITKFDREPKRLQSIVGKKAHNNKQIIKNCLKCNMEIKIPPSKYSIRKFCSAFCYAQMIKIKHNNNQKYIRIIINGRKVLQHRYIMEMHLNRKLMPNEHVHHINHIKTDNRIENLEILSISDHAKKHARNPF